MSRGKRYNGEEKLNMKKVIGVLVTIAIIVGIIFGIKLIMNADKGTMASKNVELNYYPLFSNGNWGVVNSYGEAVVEPAFGEMIIVPNKAKPVFVCTYEVNYVEGTYKTKVINDKNESLFTNYDEVTVIQNYDENNTLWLESNVLRVKKDGKYGLINLDGNEVLACEYDSITALKGIKNSILIKKEGTFGLTNSDGTTIIPTEYSEITALTDNSKSGYIVKNSEGKYGVIKCDGNIALSCIYADIKHVTDNGMYIAKADDGWKVVAEDGTSYLEGKVENAVSINGGNVITNNNGKYGIFSIDSEAKVPEEYEELSYAFDGYYIAKKDGKYGVIGLNNETAVEFKYSAMNYNKTTDYIKAQNDNGLFDYITRDLQVKLTAGNENILNNGYISVSVNSEEKYYNYKLEEKSNKDVYSGNTLFIAKQNGKYGFVDANGKLIVDYIYEGATEQNAYGYSAIKKDGKWGAIDQHGNVVVEPKYTLNNNQKIDFIGKWHVCADKNANYFTDVE